MSQLSQEDHHKVLQLGLQFRKGDTESRNVYIRDQLVSIFEKFLIRMRLLPHEVGIHPENRNNDVITAVGVWLRGKRILASGFSKVAIGIVYAFEDHPIEQRIAKHTVAVTDTDEFGTFDRSTIKVGPANWTHSNQFVNMVKCRSKCSHPDLPTIDGRIDSDLILKEAMNAGMSEYITDGMYFRVFPYWVERAYPWLPDCFQSASNQEQQVQEGTGFNHVYKSVVFVFSGCLLKIASSDPTGSDPTGTYRARPESIPSYLIRSI